MTKKKLARIRKVLEKIQEEIKGNADGFFGRGLAGEGYAGAIETG